MKYVLMFTSQPDLDAALDPDFGAEVYKRIYEWFGTGYASGHIVEGGAELKEPSTATTIKHNPDGAEPLVTDGPYLELKEIIGGFSIIAADDLDGALAYAKTWPALAMPGHGVEVRPMVEDYSQFE